MLILSARPGETIIINHNIRVTAIETHTGHVRLGFDAPKDIVIHREKVEQIILSMTTKANGEADRDEQVKQFTEAIP